MRNHVSPNVFRFLGLLMAVVGVILLFDRKWGAAVALFAIAAVQFALWMIQRRRMDA